MMISRCGDAFTTVAVSWLVLDLAGPRELGLVLLCFGVPRILTGAAVGGLLDRHEPRRLLVLDNACRGLLVLAIPVLVWADQVRVWQLCAIAGSCAMLSSVTEVAEGALAPRMVEREHLEAANSLLAVNWELAYIAGPAAAGALIALGGVGWALDCGRCQLRRHGDDLPDVAEVCHQHPQRPPDERGTAQRTAGPRCAAAVSSGGGALPADPRRASGVRRR
jgi:MFS family permease